MLLRRLANALAQHATAARALTAAAAAPLLPSRIPLQRRPLLSSSAAPSMSSIAASSAAAMAAPASATDAPAASSSPLPSPPPAVIATRTWIVDPASPPAVMEAQLGEAAAVLQQGGLVAFPTETVYGLGGSESERSAQPASGASIDASAELTARSLSTTPSDALSSSALSGIYVAKGRPSDNPLIVHVHSHAQFLSLGRDIPRLALRLAERFWPGPLTLIVPTSRGEGAASEKARAGLDCVGVRMPNHPVALALLRACGVPLAAPSANLSGRPSPTTAAHVATDLTGRVAGIVDGGAAEGVGLESTVVECEDGASDSDPGWVTILRPGGITREMLEEVVGVGRVRIDPAIAALQASPVDQSAAVQSLPKQSAKRGTERADVASLLGSPSPASASAAAAASSSPSPSPAAPASPATPATPSTPGPKAPGMKYTHYAPRAPLLLVSGRTSFLLESAAPYLARGDVVGVLATEESRAEIESWLLSRGFDPALLHLMIVGRRSDLASVARGLYGALRAFDDTAVQIILSEMFPSEGGLGEAVMNRLNKAAGGRIIHEPVAAAASAAAAADGAK